MICSLSMPFLQFLNIAYFETKRCALEAKYKHHQKTCWSYTKIFMRTFLAFSTGSIELVTLLKNQDKDDDLTEDELIEMRKIRLMIKY